MVWDVESDQVTLMMYTCGEKVRANEWVTKVELQAVPDTIYHDWGCPVARTIPTSVPRTQHSVSGTTQMLHTFI